MEKKNTSLLPAEIQNTEKSVVIYKSEDGTIQLEVQLQNETVWLTQAQIACLFGVKRPAVTKHIRNIYASGELEENITCSILEHKGNDDSQLYSTKYYNLDVVLSVGYRVNSINATRFRKWASRVLKEYLLRGYVINYRFKLFEEKYDKRLNIIENELKDHKEKIDFFVKTSLPPVEGIFYDGEIFDAYTFISALIRKAQKEIILIDNYIDDSVLKMLDKREAGVLATIYTSNISEKLELDLEKHNSQYPPINIEVLKKCHDRFLIIDDDVYHIGASFKDLGKSVFAFSKMGLEKEEILSIL